MLPTRPNSDKFTSASMFLTIYHLLNFLKIPITLKMFTLKNAKILSQKLFDDQTKKASESTIYEGEPFLR